MVNRVSRLSVACVPVAIVLALLGPARGAASAAPLPSVPPAAKGPSSPVRPEVTAGARDLVRVLGTFFPPMEGQVTGTGPGTEVSLDRGADDGLYPGAVVLVYRPGVPFLDAYTGLFLGHREIRVGWVEIRSAGSHEATGVFEGPKSAVSGDRFRLPASLVRIALVPASRYADLAVLSHLTRALQRSRRFSVVDPFRVDLAIRKMGKADLSDPSFRVRLAKDLRAQNLVLVDTTLEADHALLSLDVVGGLTGKTAFSLSAGLSGVEPLSGGGSLLARRAADLKSAALPPLSVPIRTSRVPLIPFFLTEGTFIPGKPPMTAISDGRRIIVGSIGKSRIRTHYRESDPRVSANRHVFISSGPVIAPTPEFPGQDQIAVTNIVAGAPDSYVLDYDGTTFRRIAKHLPWYIRIVRMQDGRVRLLGQKMGVNNAFLGSIRILRWRLDHFEAGPKVGWPEVISLFGTTPVMTGNHPDFLKVATDNHLEYYDARGDLRFKSPIFLGGYSNHFVYGRRHALLPVQSRSVRVKGRILVVAPAGDRGRPVAIVYKNIPMSAGFGNFQGYQYGQVYFYRWTGINWVMIGELTRVKNFIRDITLVDDPVTGAPDLLVGTEPVFNFMNIQNLIVKEGTVLFFRLPGTVRKLLNSGSNGPSLINRPAGGR